MTMFFRLLFVLSLLLALPLDARAAYNACWCGWGDPGPDPFNPRDAFSQVSGMVCANYWVCETSTSATSGELAIPACSMVDTNPGDPFAPWAVQDPTACFQVMATQGWPKPLTSTRSLAQWPRTEGGEWAAWAGLVRCYPQLSTGPLFPGSIYDFYYDTQGNIGNWSNCVPPILPDAPKPQWREEEKRGNAAVATYADALAVSLKLASTCCGPYLQGILTQGSTLLGATGVLFALLAQDPIDLKYQTLPVVTVAPTTVVTRDCFVKLNGIEKCYVTDEQAALLTKMLANWENQRAVMRAMQKALDRAETAASFGDKYWAAQQTIYLQATLKPWLSQAIRKEIKFRRHFVALPTQKFPADALAAIYPQGMEFYLDYLADALVNQEDPNVTLPPVQP